MGRPNVLLVVLDSVRARNVGAYGYHRDTAPFLDEYCDEATLYRQARAPGIHSVASHASLWTGVHVEEHRLVQHEDELLPGTTVWETLGDEGYETGLFTTNPVITRASNLSEPFGTIVTDETDRRTYKPFPGAFAPTDVRQFEGVVGNMKRCLRDERPIRSFLNSIYQFIDERRQEFQNSATSADMIAEFEEWLSSSEAPWAACINLMDAHFPYEPGEMYDRWGGKRLREIHSEVGEKPLANEFLHGRPWWQLEAFEHLYDGTIREADAHLEDIIEVLKQVGSHDETLVVVTSDHGEGFGELSRLTNRTRMIDHSWGIHEVLTHVPLVVKYPGQTERATVDKLASLTEFPRTVRSVIDGDVCSHSFVPDGPVVASTYRLREQDDSIFERSDERVEDYYGPWRAVYERADGDVTKYVNRNDESVVVRITDAQNSCHVDSGTPEKVRDVFDTFDRLNLKKAGTRNVSERVEDQLSELGYLR